MIDFIQNYTVYDWLCLIGFPFLVLIGVEVVIRQKTKKIAYKWKRAEQSMVKTWENDEFTATDKTIKTHIRGQLFGKEFVFLIIALNLVVPPLALDFKIWITPVLLGIPSFILFLVLINKKEKILLENGLKFSDIIHHESLKKSIGDVATYRPYITYPYAFFYHYEKLLAIPERMNELIRSDVKSHIAISESKVLGEEENYLLDETYIAVTGRLRNYDANIETEGVKAMQKMIRYAKTPTLPLDIREKAMVLARKLQYRSDYELIDEANQLEQRVSRFQKEW